MELPKNDDGSYQAYAWPGGYPIAYYCADGGVLCPNCANRMNGSIAQTDDKDDKQWYLIGADIHWEGPPIQCDHCNGDIESAYGDPDTDTDTN